MRTPHKIGYVKHTKPGEIAILEKDEKSLITRLNEAVFNSLQSQGGLINNLLLVTFHVVIIIFTAAIAFVYVFWVLGLIT